MKNLPSIVKEGLKDEISKKRLTELEHLKAEIMALTLDENDLIKVKSTIEISITPNDSTTDS